MPSALSTNDVAIIVGSLVIVLSVGLASSRRQEKTAAGYFLASKKLPWWIIGASFVSTSVSSEQIVGTIGEAYANGMSVANSELWALPPYTLLILFFIPVYLHNRVTTIPDFFRRRYGPLCADLYSGVMLVAYVVIFLVPVLYGGSYALAGLTPWSFTVILWTTIAVVGAYTVKGGLVAVAWTDAAQCLMLLGGGLVLFFLAMHQLPGGIFEAWEAMRQARPERFHLYRPPDDPIAPFPGLIAGTFGIALFYQATNQVMIQRVLGARTVRDGVLGIVFAGFINFLRPLVTCFLGFIVFHWIHVLHNAPPLDNKDQTFAFALKTFAPEWGLRGLILAGFLAAVMSTVSSLANSIATVFAFDVYGKWINPAATDRRLVTAGRAASFAALVAAGIVAPVIEHIGIYKYFQTAVTYLATPFASIVLTAVFWKRANYPGAVFGIIGGLVIQIGLAVDLYIVGISLHWLYVGAIAQALTMIGIVSVSLATPPPAPESWQPFVWRRGLLEGYQQGPRLPWYKRVSFWFAVYAAGWIAIYAWLW